MDDQYRRRISENYNEIIADMIITTTIVPRLVSIGITQTKQSQMIMLLIKGETLTVNQMIVEQLEKRPESEIKWFIEIMSEEYNQANLFLPPSISSSSATSGVDNSVVVVVRKQLTRNECLKNINSNITAICSEMTLSPEMIRVMVPDTPMVKVNLARKRLLSSYKIHVENKCDSYAMNSEFITYLSNRSLEEMVKFADLLKETHQHHIAILIIPER